MSPNKCFPSNYNAPHKYPPKTEVRLRNRAQGAYCRLVLHAYQLILGIFD